MLLGSRGERGCGTDVLLGSRGERCDTDVLLEGQAREKVIGLVIGLEDMVYLFEELEAWLCHHHRSLALL